MILVFFREKPGIEVPRVGKKFSGKVPGAFGQVLFVGIPAVRHCPKQVETAFRCQREHLGKRVFVEETRLAELEAVSFDYFLNRLEDGAVQAVVQMHGVECQGSKGHANQSAHGKQHLGFIARKASQAGDLACGCRKIGEVVLGFRAFDYIEYLNFPHVFPEQPFHDRKQLSIFQLLVEAGAHALGYAFDTYGKRAFVSGDFRAHETVHLGKYIRPLAHEINLLEHGV